MIWQPNKPKHNKASYYFMELAVLYVLRIASVINIFGFNTKHGVTCSMQWILISRSGQLHFITALYVR